MPGRSLRASAAGIQAIRKAIKRDDWKQDELKDELGLKTRQPITRLLRGEAIERSTFEELCHLLGLEVKDVAEPEETQQASENQIDALVQQIRETIRAQVKERCGTMRVLDMTHPIALTGEQGIYTSVNILEKITGRRRLGLSKLFQDFELEAFDRFGLTRVTETRVPGLEAVQRYPKLIVLGKPGAGKTTFLKFLAMQCMAGGFLADRVPLFVTLKDFAEAEGQPGLLEYGDRWIGTSLHPIYTAGKALVLLDGLDEVREEDTDRVLTQIQHLSDRFPNNHFVVTCRIAAKEYTSRFEQFTEVEVADFNDEQIKTFVNNWFCCKDADHAEELANTFIAQLETHEPIKELATNPLLLTLLCLEFEETLEFPSNRSELYDRGIRILLSKWDASRRIKRDEVYKKLSLNRKEDLLSQIALITFEQKDYFFKQRTIESYIRDYIQNLPDAQTDPEILQLNSETVLKSIEGQHGLLVERAKGIYSFSHLTFHEYFAAREIVSSVGTQGLVPIQNLVNHITEERWREVFLLTAGMMRNADELLRLMKKQIDQLLADDEKLQQFLEWIDKKAETARREYLYNLAYIRAYYFELSLSTPSKTSPDLDFDSRLSWEIDFASQFEECSDLTTSNLWIDFCLYATLAHALNRSIDSDFVIPQYVDLPKQLEEALEVLEEEISDLRDETYFERWCEKYAQNWSERLRVVMIQHRDIGHDWQFSNEQKELLQKYYNTSLLLRCIDSGCYVSRSLREEIEETLLLPIAEIERRKKEKK